MLIEPTVVYSPKIGDAPPKSTLYYGQDCREVLRQLPEQSVHMVATSPPYWGLRRYPNGESILREDLTEEERLFVFSELERLGIRPIATLLGHGALIGNKNGTKT